MKRIRILGAGRSAYHAIKYLYDHAHEKQWEISVADAMQANLDACRADFPGLATQKLDVADTVARQAFVKAADVVISLLPSYFHTLVAKDCVEFGAHLATPSYISADMQKLDAEASAKNVTILNEMGLDPGIDHLSSMNIINRLKGQGAALKWYRSCCGGLMAADSADNPWRYKLSWNPYNVVRAGSDGALYRTNGHFQYVPYHRLFDEAQNVKAGNETFEMYLNRDATRYIELYGLHDIGGFLRGTLRYPGFCSKWNALVHSGLTSDKIDIEVAGGTSWAQYLEGFSLGHGVDTETKKALEWLFADDTEIMLRTATPAANLQKLLETKWQMNPSDKDRVIMLHEFGYKLEGKSYILKSLMDIEGEDAQKTAMAKTVGLPLAIAAGLLAEGAIKTFGVILPLVSEVYTPILQELDKEGIRFAEEVVPIEQNNKKGK